MKIEGRDYLAFLRTENCLYSWEYYYPAIGEQDKKEKQVHCYCSSRKQPEYFSKDSLLAKNKRTEQYFKWIDFDLLPDFENASYKAIKDTLFFDGHFKAYRQGENIFIINQKHGEIYFLDKKEIIKIGTIDLMSYKYKIDNVKVYIEDKDNDRLIFFAPIKWEKEKYPKPNIEVIKNDNDIEKIFGKNVKHLISN